jgi:hypothetical protein
MKVLEIKKLTIVWLINELNNPNIYSNIIKITFIIKKIIEYCYICVKL